MSDDKGLYRYNTTVEDLIYALGHFPKDAKISICGGNICSISVDSKQTVVTLHDHVL